MASAAAAAPRALGSVVSVFSCSGGNRRQHVNQPIGQTFLAVRPSLKAARRQQMMCHCSAKEDRQARNSVSKPKGNCYGCGQPFQTVFPDSAGFVTEDQYQLKAKHKQLNTLLCHRCVSLTHGKMVPGVKDFTQKQASDDEVIPKILTTPEELREQLKAVQTQRAIVVMLVDLLDASGSFLGRVRDLVGRNPVMLIGTKFDLLPKGTHPEDVEEWLLETAAHKRVNVAGVKVISSRTGQGVPQAVGAIRKERRGRDVFVVGAANVGKSAFVRALLKEMGSMNSMQFDAASIQLAKHAPVESAMPGTTLRLIPLRAFATGEYLYDTPGLHLDHRIPHLLTPKELKEIHPRRMLRPYLAPRVEEFSEDEEPGATFLWGGIVRIDVVHAPVGTQLAFYGPPVMKVYGMPLLDIDDEIDLVGGDADDEEGEEGLDEDGLDVVEMGEEEGALFGAESVARRGGLRMSREAVLTTTGRQEPLADIAISGMSGWVSVLAPNRKGQEVVLRVFVPKGVESFVRPPMPVPNPKAQQRLRKMPVQ